MHPTSCLFHLLRKGLSGGGNNDKFAKKLPTCVVYADLLVTNKQYMRNIVVIDQEWLEEAAPHVFKRFK